MPSVPANVTRNFPSGTPSRSGASVESKKSSSVPFGNQGGARCAVAADRVDVRAERPRHCSDRVGAAVQLALEQLRELHGQTGRDLVQARRGSGPEVAHVEHERRPLQPRNRPARAGR